ncbi:MAG: type II secretion system minor pseudopilin GspI [Burkholderiales bacterium]|nr:MAG: type II secretion system minor pseudopilin GspI [Burkholderiales bacterium]
MRRRGRSGGGRGARGLAHASGGASGGFTLVEVLVALTIAAVALMASLRAASNLTEGALDLRARAFAQWSAENRLAQIRAQGEWPSTGRREYPCPQGDLELVCREVVFTTPNPWFRRVEVSVYPAPGSPLAGAGSGGAGSGSVRLARLVGFAISGQIQ